MILTFLTSVGIWSLSVFLARCSLSALRVTGSSVQPARELWMSQGIRWPFSLEIGRFLIEVWVGLRAFSDCSITPELSACCFNCSLSLSPSSPGSLGCAVLLYSVPCQDALSALADRLKPWSPMLEADAAEACKRGFVNQRSFRFFCDWWLLREAWGTCPSSASIPLTHQCQPSSAVGI